MSIISTNKFETKTRMYALPRFLLLITLLFLSWICPVNPAQASVPLNAQFKATQACQAFQSIRKETNPGNVRLNPNTISPVTAKNKEDAT